MTVEEALGLVEEVKNCSLPWDDAHWDALCMVINYVKDKLHEDFQNTLKPSDLPHWKKSNLPYDNSTGFNSDYFCYKGYNINYKELFEKLPKDD